MIDNGKKLNLKWVSEAIGDDYKNWKQGEIVLLNTQTGTGKTCFIVNTLLDYIEDYEQILFVCNRTNLKRQFKKELLDKYGLEIPESLDELDKITTIKNIVITSYHAIQDSILDIDYDITKFRNDLDNYSYIILDESHYILADGNFNNKTRLAFNLLVKDYHRHSVKIFISATMDEIREPINNYTKNILGKKPKIHDYTTGIDYSYIKPSYFKNLESIITTIKNDTTDDKWLVFVSSIDDAENIRNELGKDNCTIIKSGTKNDDLSEIINNSKFECKVLVATKTLDNGISIKDDQLKNIVIMAWDKITFIQMLGRKRINIDNAQQVNLYIMTRYKKSFLQKIFRYDKKMEKVDLFKKKENEFNRKYDNDLRKLGNLNELFYRGQKDGKYKLNIVGYYRLIKDKKFAEYMIDKFEAKVGELKKIEVKTTTSINGVFYMTRNEVDKAFTEPEYCIYLVIMKDINRKISDCYKILNPVEYLNIKGDWLYEEISDNNYGVIVKSASLQFYLNELFINQLEKVFSYDGANFE